MTMPGLYQTPDVATPKRGVNPRSLRARTTRAQALLTQHSPTGQPLQPPQMPLPPMGAGMGSVTPGGPTGYDQFSGGQQGAQDLAPGFAAPPGFDEGGEVTTEDDQNTTQTLGSNLGNRASDAQFFSSEWPNGLPDTKQSFIDNPQSWTFLPGFNPSGGPQYQVPNSAVPGYNPGVGPEYQTLNPATPGVYPGPPAFFNPNLEIQPTYMIPRDDYNLYGGPQRGYSDLGRHFAEGGEVDFGGSDTPPGWDDQAWQEYIARQNAGDVPTPQVAVPYAAQVQQMLQQNPQAANIAAGEAQATNGVANLAAYIADYQNRANTGDTPVNQLGTAAFTPAGREDIRAALGSLRADALGQQAPNAGYVSTAPQGYTESPLTSAARVAAGPMQVYQGLNPEIPFVTPAIENYVKPLAEFGINHGPGELGALSMLSQLAGGPDVGKLAASQIPSHGLDLALTAAPFAGKAVEGTGAALGAGRGALEAQALKGFEFRPQAPQALNTVEQLASRGVGIPAGAALNPDEARAIRAAADSAGITSWPTRQELSDAHGGPTALQQAKEMLGQLGQSSEGVPSRVWDRYEGIGAQLYPETATADQKIANAARLAYEGRLETTGGNGTGTLDAARRAAGDVQGAERTQAMAGAAKQNQAGGFEEQLAAALRDKGVTPPGEGQVVRVAVNPEAVTPLDPNSLMGSRGAVELRDPAGARILAPGEQPGPGEILMHHGTGEAGVQGELRPGTNLTPNPQDAQVFARTASRLEGGPSPNPNSPAERGFTYGAKEHPTIDETRANNDALNGMSGHDADAYTLARQLAEDARNGTNLANDPTFVKSLEYITPEEQAAIRAEHASRLEGGGAQSVPSPLGDLGRPVAPEVTPPPPPSSEVAGRFYSPAETSANRALPAPEGTGQGFTMRALTPEEMRSGYVMYGPNEVGPAQAPAEVAGRFRDPAETTPALPERTLTHDTGFGPEAPTEGRGFQMADNPNPSLSANERINQAMTQAQESVDREINDRLNQVFGPAAPNGRVPAGVVNAEGVNLTGPEARATIPVESPASLDFKASQNGVNSQAERATGGVGGAGMPPGATPGTTGGGTQPPNLRSTVTASDNYGKGRNSSLIAKLAADVRDVIGAPSRLTTMIHSPFFRANGGVGLAVTDWGAAGAELKAYARGLADPAVSDALLREARSNPNLVIGGAPVGKWATDAPIPGAGYLDTGPRGRAGFVSEGRGPNVKAEAREPEWQSYGQSHVANAMYNAPVLGSLLQRSEASTAGQMNTLRLVTYAKEAERALQAGHTAPEYYDGIKKAVELATGRGTWNPLSVGGVSPFFSGRALSARFETPFYAMQRAVMHGEVLHGGGAVALRQLAGSVGFGTSMLALAQATGVADKVNMMPGANWLKAEFNHVTNGVITDKTTIDPFGGYGPIARLVLKVADAAAGGDQGAAINAGVQFARNQLGPVPGKVAEVFSGQDWLGRQIGSGGLPTSLGEMYDRLKAEGNVDTLRDLTVPIFANEMYDAFTHMGPAGIALALPSYGAMSTSSYGASLHEMRQSVLPSDMQYGDLFPKEKQALNSAIQQSVPGPYAEAQKTANELTDPAIIANQQARQQVKEDKAAQVAPILEGVRDGKYDPGAAYRAISEINHTAQQKEQALLKDPKYLEATKDFSNNDSLAQRALSTYYAIPSSYVGANGKIDWQKADATRVELIHSLAENGNADLARRLLRETETSNLYEDLKKLSPAGRK